MDKIKITPLGGLDENGRDCYVIEINDDMFVIDAGASLPDKNIPGIDFVLPNVTYIINNRNRLKGYILTHGHDEQMSALKYFYKSAPATIYCTSATKMSLLSQAKMRQVDTSMMVFDIKKPSDKFVVAGHTIHFFQTCHNMAYSCGVSFETDRGNIVYTGDFIVDYDVSDPAYYFDLQKLSEISEKNTLVLMAESKAANKNGYCAPRHRITSKIEKCFKEEQKRIFICCFWQNFFRIKEICNLVKKYHKKLFFYDTYTENVMNSLLLSDASLFSTTDVVPNSEFLRVRRQDLVILMLGLDKELYDNINKLASGDNEDKRISLDSDDIYISAAIPTPTLEMQAVRSVDNLYRTKCKVIWISGKDVTSMHARQDDLKLFLTLLKPKYYFPIRGNFVNLIDNAKLALSIGVGLSHNSIFVLDKGNQLIFDDIIPSISQPDNNKIDVSPVLVDGKGISMVADSVIEDRNKLGQNGVVIVACSISMKERKIIAGPDCQMRGFVYVKEAEPLLKSISEIFVEEIELELSLTNPDLDAAKTRILDRSRKFIKRENDRDPYILPIIAELE